MQACETYLPCGAIVHARIVVRGKIYCSLEGVADPIDGVSRAAFLELRVAEAAEIADRERADQFPRECVRQMHTHAGGVGNVAASRSQVGVIVSERLGHGHRLLAFTFVAAREAPRAFYGLPVIQDGAAIRDLKIIGVRKGVGPVTSFPERRLYDPRPDLLVATIKEMRSGADLHRIRFLAHVELQPGAPGFEIGGSDFPGHLAHPSSKSVPKVSPRRENTAKDTH